MNAKSKTHTYTEPNDSNGFVGCMNASLLLVELWERCVDTLTDDQLASVGRGIDNAASELCTLSKTMSDVATLISADHRSESLRAGTLDDASVFLYSVASQIETLTAMIEIGDAANSRLIYRSRHAGRAGLVLQKGGLRHE
jgi:hypothetical protein